MDIICARPCILFQNYEDSQNMYQVSKSIDTGINSCLFCFKKQEAVGDVYISSAAS